MQMSARPLTPSSRSRSIGNVREAKQITLIKNCGGDACFDKRPSLAHVLPMLLMLLSEEGHYLGRCF